MADYLTTNYFAPFPCPCCDSRRVICCKDKWRCYDCGLDGGWDDAGNPIMFWPVVGNSTDTK